MELTPLTVINIANPLARSLVNRKSEDDDLGPNAVVSNGEPVVSDTTQITSTL
jgi:hypothetical protein